MPEKPRWQGVIGTDVHLGGNHSIILQFRTSTELKSPGLGAQVLGYIDTWVLESNSPLLGTPPEAYQVAPVYVVYKVR